MVLRINKILREILCFTVALKSFGTFCIDLNYILLYSPSRREPNRGFSTSKLIPELSPLNKTVKRGIPQSCKLATFKPRSVDVIWKDLQWRLSNGLDKIWYWGHGASTGKCVIFKVLWKKYFIKIDSMSVQLMFACVAFSPTTSRFSAETPQSITSFRSSRLPCVLFFSNFCLILPYYGVHWGLVFLRFQYFSDDVLRTYASIQRTFQVFPSGKNRG